MIFSYIHIYNFFYFRNLIQYNYMDYGLLCDPWVVC
uniref:Uncharacterized protein n=1 Tax=virus sp. ctiha2 TaxID=2827299 RepID=A0A8S5RHU7_9VIRU|nr:MAG TPA: hypothetical protein [virus sp. ctiha2]DAX97770.1 MAG TPA: hypothetical protein [Caudoviricetes sp.]